MAPTKASVDLDPQVFGIEPNIAVMHQVVTAQLAARRAGTQSTKTRAEVAGGGAKPWKQKGTGRARQGSIRAPHCRHGGVALGPKPRSYRQRTPKKMIRLALRSALSDRAAEGKVLVVDELGLGLARPPSRPSPPSPASRCPAGCWSCCSATRRPLWKSFRNLPEVQCLDVAELNAYDVLVNDWLVFTTDTLPGGTPASGDTGDGRATDARPALPAGDEEGAADDEETAP